MYENLLNNPELARLVADVTGDGHLQIQDWRYLTSFVSNEIEEIEAFEKRSKELFNVIPKRYMDSRKTCKGSGTRYQSFIISKPVALFLRDNGVPVGNKTNNPFMIPDWIFNGSLEMQSAYLRGLFDNEGSIFCRNPARWQIGFTMAKNETILDAGIFYMNQIRKLLADFDIHCSPVRVAKLNVRKDGSQSYQMVFNIEINSFIVFVALGISLRIIS